MKTKIGLTNLWVLLLIFLLSGCMPDSMTKWEENPPKKAEEPVTVVTDTAPANYSYSNSLGAGVTSIAIDVNETFPTLVPNENIIGNENGTLVFSVSPSLPSGVSLNAITGKISGTATTVTASNLYTFMATNNAGSTTYTLTIEVTQASKLTAVEYEAIADDELGYYPLLSNSDVGSLKPTLTGGSSTTWTISPGTAATATCPNSIEILTGLCFSTTTGIITGTPTDSSPLAATTFTVTASKLSPASSVQTSFGLKVFDLPSGLSYEQNNIVELSTTSLTASGIAIGQYIQLEHITTSSTIIAHVENVISTNTLIVKKINATDKITNNFEITSYSSSSDMSSPTSITPITLYQASNVYESGNEISLTPSLTTGTDVTYSITPSYPPTGITNGSFNTETGEITGTVDTTFEETTFTVTVTNAVGATTEKIIIKPLELPPAYLSYSYNVLLMVRDATYFSVGDLVSATGDGETTGAYGRVVGKYYDSSTLTSALVVNMQNRAFAEAQSIDNHYPFNAEKTTIYGYKIIDVADASSFSVGDYISNSNAAFGKIRAISDSTIYVSIISGEFFKDDSIDNSYPYSAVETTVTGVRNDRVIIPNTASLTVLTGNTTSASVTPAKLGDYVTSGTNKGLITLAEISPVVAITMDDISAYELEDTITQGAVSGTIYAIIEGAAPAGTVYVKQVSGGDFATGVIGATNASIVNYGHRFFFRGTVGQFTLGDTITTQSGTSGTLSLIEASNYIANATDNFPTDVKVRTGASIATVNANGLTGNNVGRISYKDSFLSKVHFEMTNGVLTNGMTFDTKNPIDQSLVGKYSTISSVSTAKDIIIKMGTPVTITHALQNQVNATYTISPPLPDPANFKLDSTTGVISGTPSTASEMKTYTVKATNDLGSTTTTFNMKITNFFELQINSTQDSYVLHRIGKKNGSRACRVYQDQLSSGEVEELEMVCFLEANELDLFMLGLDLNVVAGPGMCNHIKAFPYGYNSIPRYAESSTSTDAFYSVTNTSGCTPTIDDDRDGHIDYIISVAADGDCTALTSDGDGDGDCAAENTAIDRDGDGHYDYLVPVTNGGCTIAVGAGNYDDGDGDGDCTLENTSYDTDGDGVRDYLVYNPAGGACNITVTPGAGTHLDNDGDGNCSEEYFFGVDFSFHQYTPASITGTNLCKSNIDEDHQCDEGSVTAKAITFSKINGTTICDYTIENSDNLECAGDAKKCVSGATQGASFGETTLDDFESVIQTMTPNVTTLTNFKTKIPITEKIYNGNYLANYFINHDFFTVANREVDYSFDIRGFRTFFLQNTLGIGDPGSGGNPTYSFDCLDAAYNAKAKIHIFVRDWDTVFSMSSPIDKNNQRTTLDTIFAHGGGDTITMTNAIDSTKIAVGSIISTGNTANGMQNFAVTDIDTGTKEITLSPTPSRDYVGLDVYYTPITAFDELNRITDTMDVGYFADPVFAEYTNKKLDFDDNLNHDYSASLTADYLTKMDYITETLIEDQLPVTTVLHVVNRHYTFTEIPETYEITAVSGNVVTIDTPLYRDLLENVHVLYKDNGVGNYIYYGIETAKTGDTQLTVYPLTRPFDIDYLRD